MKVGWFLIATWALGGLAEVPTAALQGSAGDHALAIALSNDETERAAVSSIVALGESKVPLLLSWTRRPPRYVSECGLFGGLADALGELRVARAIPYLVKNIGGYRSCGVNLAPWLKTEAAIEWNLPAVGALVKIGPSASKAVMAAFPIMETEEDRRAAVFVISRIKGVSEARSFLVSVSQRADRERYWAEQSIKRLDALTPLSGGN